MKQTHRALLRRRNTTFATFQAALDGVVIIVLLYVLSAILFGYLPLLYMLFCLVLLATIGIVYDRLGIYRHNSGFFQKIILLLKAWGITFAILLSIGFLSKTSQLFSRQFLGLFFITGAPLLIVVHILTRYVHGRFRDTHEQTHALLIGTDQLAEYMYQTINDNPWLTEKILGAVEIGNSDRPPDQPPQKQSSIPVMGNLADIHSLVEEHEIRTVYVAVPLDSSPLINDIYFSLLDKNVDVHWAPNIFALNLVNHSVKELAGIPIITLSETPLVGSNLLLKTIEDKVLSLIALLLASPIMLAAMVAVKLSSPGPVFFKQERTGWDGKPFKIWKFRSMRIHEPDKVIKQATKDDPRITPVGKFLRRTSIDELPQLINVFQGSMSLVGPRPHAISHNEEYAKRIQAYLARHRIKPGITGLAQVRGFRGETKELIQMSKRVESDLEYINNWSIWLDLSILVRTVFTLFSKNAY